MIGIYTIMWYWAFNVASDVYTTCFEVEVTEPEPTMEPTILPTSMPSITLEPPTSKSVRIVPTICLLITFSVWFLL